MTEETHCQTSIGEVSDSYLWGSASLSLSLRLTGTLNVLLCIRVLLSIVSLWWCVFCSHCLDLSSLSLSLSISLSLSLSLTLFISCFLSLSLSLSLSVTPSCLSLSVSLFLSLTLFFPLSVVFLLFCMFFSLSLSVSLSLLHSGSLFLCLLGTL